VIGGELQAFHLAVLVLGGNPNKGSLCIAIVVTKAVDGLVDAGVILAHGGN